MHFLLLILFVVTSFALPGRALAQGGSYTLWGDVKITEATADTHAPLSVTLVLHNVSEGRENGRQNVSGRGRYRFSGLRVGEYEIAVENQEGEELTRARVVITNSPNNDVRQDFEFEWRPRFGRPKTAVGAISAADIYDRPAPNRPLFQRAQEAAEKQNYGQAAVFLKQILDADKNDFQAWTLLGTVFSVEGKHADAEKAYIAAIEARPAFGLALLNLGRLRTSQKKFEEAIDPLTRAVSAQPMSAEANFLLGESYLRIKKGSKAVPYLNEAGRLGWLDAHLRLAWLYDAAGMKAKAADEYAQLLKKKPDYADRRKLEEYIARNKKP